MCRYRVNAPRRFPVGCAVITLRPKLSPQVISPQVITPHRRSCAAVVQRTGYARGVAIVHPPRKMPRCAPHKFCKSYQISPQHEPQRRPTATPRRVRRVAALSYFLRVSVPRSSFPYSVRRVGRGVASALVKAEPRACQLAMVGWAILPRDPLPRGDLPAFRLRGVACRAPRRAVPAGRAPGCISILSLSVIDRQIDCWVSRRYTTHDATQFRDAGSLTPRHKGTVCGDDEYAPINLGTPGLLYLSIYLSIYLCPREFAASFLPVLEVQLLGVAAW